MLHQNNCIVYVRVIMPSPPAKVPLAAQTHVRGRFFRNEAVHRYTTAIEQQSREL